MSCDQSDFVTKADTYLQLCEERRLGEAAKYLASDVTLTFPGPVQFHNLPDMVADAAGRYREVRKHRTMFLVGTRVSDGSPFVTSTGTLDGERLDGTMFTGVRYSDTCVFRDGVIAEQYVFNDLAESGASPRLADRVATRFPGTGPS